MLERELEVLWAALGESRRSELMLSWLESLSFRSRSIILEQPISVIQDADETANHLFLIFHDLKYGA